MQILLTGSRGMLGSSLISRLSSNESEIFGPTRKELDLSNGSKVLDYLSRYKPDLIIHTAARVGGIDANIDSPFEHLTENIQMDSNLFTAAKIAGIKNFLYMASSCMYPRVTLQPMKESQLLTGALEPTNEGYALAKIVGMKSIETASVQFGLNWRTLILSNLFGPNDHFNSKKSHLLAAIITKVEAANRENLGEIEMWGSGRARREFTYVNDVANFVASNLSNIEKFPLAMNVGAGRDYSVLEYYEMVMNQAGFRGKIKADPSRPEGMPQKLMDSSLSKSFGWNPGTTIENAIAETYNWYLNSLQGAD